MALHLIAKCTDPPAQLLERFVAMLVRQRTDDVVNLRGASRERVNQAKPGGQIRSRIFAKQLPAGGNLVLQLPHSDDVGSLTKTAQAHCLEVERVERVRDSLNDVWAKQL